MSTERLARRSRALFGSSWLTPSRRALGCVALGSLALGSLTLAQGCSMTGLAISTQAEVMEQAAPVIDEQTDYELVRIAAPANLFQIDGLLRVAPDEERLLLLGARGWASYAYAFLEDGMEQAEASGNMEQADAERARARQMYLKAKSLGLRWLTAQAPGLPQAIARDPDVLQAFLAKNFTERSSAPALFWTGSAWGSAIGISLDDPTLIADLPLAQELVERSVELDEAYDHAAGHTFLGVVSSSRGVAVGGDPENGRKHFERALELTGRAAFLVQVNYARFHAVQTQDRALFIQLLDEVLRAGTPASPALTLPNLVARRRAQRLMARVDTLFLPPLPETPPEPAPAPSSSNSPAKESRASCIDVRS